MAPDAAGPRPFFRSLVHGLTRSRAALAFLAATTASGLPLLCAGSAGAGMMHAGPGLNVGAGYESYLTALPGGVTAVFYETSITRIDADGAVLGTTAGTDAAFITAVASHPTAGMAAVRDTFANEFRVFRYDVNGVEIGSPLVISPAGGRAALAFDGNGALMVTGVRWNNVDDEQVGWIFDADGNPLTSEIQLATDSLGARVVGLVGGGFVVVWTTQSGSEVLIRARRFDSAGTPQGGAFDVGMSAYTIQLPYVAATDGTAFWVAWLSQGSSSAPSQAKFRTMDASGAALTDETVALEAELFFGLSIAVDPAGDAFLFSETRTSHPEAPFGVAAHYGQQFAPDGAAVGGPVRLFPDPDEIVLTSTLTATGTGRLSVSGIRWAANGCFGSQTAVLHRFCDDGDASCDVCPGFEDSIDDDGDGIPNGCDACTTSVAAPASSLRKLDSVTRDPDDAKPSTLRIEGTFTLDGPLASLQPESEGARVLIHSADFRTLFDAKLDPGSLVVGGHGWKVNTARTAWMYRTYDARDCYHRITRVLLRDMSRKSPNLVKFKILAQRTPAQILSSEVPLTVSVVFGNQAAADSGLCGAATFATSSCEYSSPLPELHCR